VFEDGESNFNDSNFFVQSGIVNKETPRDARLAFLVGFTERFGNEYIPTDCHLATSC